MNLRVSTLLLSASGLLFASCGNLNSSNGRGPIALGDPATIVTETDSQYLQDMVPDPAFDVPATAPSADTVAVAAAPARDTTPAQAPATETPAKPAPAGLTADFGDVQVILPSITASNAARSVRGAKAAAYTLRGTSFDGKTISVRGGTVKRIQQRTGHSAVVQIGSKQVLLADLGTMYSSWQTLQGKDGDYKLATPSAPAAKVSSATIRTAVQKAARKQRLDRKAEQKLLASVRSLSTPPLSLVPRAFTWKIEGADSKGKAFSKEVRVDVPL